MFLWENVVLVFGFAIVFALFANFFNMYTFTKDFLTALYLSFVFLVLLFVMPFKAIQIIFKRRNEILEHLKTQDIDLNDLEQMKIVLNSRMKIFALLYRNKNFSYSTMLLAFSKWYSVRQFRVRIKFVRDMEVREKYGKAYLDNLLESLVIR